MLCSTAKTAGLAAVPARFTRAFAAAPPRAARAPAFTRSYASPTSEGHGKPVTSGPHQTIPHAPPKPTPFFARKNIGLEVTPLMAFVGTIVTVASGFLIKNLITEDSLQHRHGVDNDEALNKVLNSDGKDTRK